MMRFSKILKVGNVITSNSHLKNSILLYRRRRTLSRQRLRRRQMDALDSGDEFSYPAYSSTLPPRPHRLDLNHLAKSAGTGLDALVIEELARSVTTLRSDVERLTAQQLSLRSDLRDSDLSRGAPVPEYSPYFSSRLHPNNTPSGSTRAMWSSRTPLRYPSQCDVQRDSGVLEEADSPYHVTSEYDPPRQTSPLVSCCYDSANSVITSRWKIVKKVSPCRL